MIRNKVICYSSVIMVITNYCMCVCVSLTFWGFIQNFEDEMGGFEKSAAEVLAAETSAANTTDTD